MEDCSGTRGQCGRPCRLEISLVTLGGDSGNGYVHEGTPILFNITLVKLTPEPVAEKP
jgi:hypothetical protein